MGKKKDCFGQEDYVCRTPSCPYARDCIKAVWEKRMEKVLLRGKVDEGGAKRSRSRITLKSLSG